MPIGTTTATASAHRHQDVDRLSPGPAPGSPSSRSTGFVLVLGAVAFGAYFVVLHLLIANRAWPTMALAMIVAPWLFVVGPPIARTARVGAPARRALVAGLALVGAIAVGAALLRYGTWFGEHAEVVLYVENFAFFGWLTWLFASSLAGGREPLVTRFARTMRRGDMPPSVTGYTRSVTIAWATFFALLMTASTALFATQSRDRWSLFVNVLVWPLLAAAFVIEYAVRRMLLKDVKHIPFSAAIHAFRERSGGAP